MPWGKVDDDFYDHPKVEERLPEAGLSPLESLAAVGLFWKAISWCNRHLTDGFVPEVRLVKLSGLPAPTFRKVRDGLIRAVLFDVAEGGVSVHDYFEEGRNKSRAQVEDERAAARERQARSRGVSRGESQRDSTRESQGEFAPPDPTHTRPRRSSTAPSAVPGRAQGNGSSDPKEHDDAVARARAKLDDPASSPDIRQAARFALDRLGEA